MCRVMETITTAVCILASQLEKDFVTAMVAFSATVLRQFRQQQTSNTTHSALNMQACSTNHDSCFLLSSWMQGICLCSWQNGLQ